MKHAKFAEGLLTHGHKEDLQIIDDYEVDYSRDSIVSSHRPSIASIAEYPILTNTLYATTTTTATATAMTATSTTSTTTTLAPPQSIINSTDDDIRSLNQQHHQHHHQQRTYSTASVASSLFASIDNDANFPPSTSGLLEIASLGESIGRVMNSAPFYITTTYMYIYI